MWFQIGKKKLPTCLPPTLSKINRVKDPMNRLTFSHQHTLLWSVYSRQKWSPVPSVQRPLKTETSTTDLFRQWVVVYYNGLDIMSHNLYRKNMETILYSFHLISSLLTFREGLVYKAYPLKPRKLVTNNKLKDLLEYSNNLV